VQRLCVSFHCKTLTEHVFFLGSWTGYACVVPAAVCQCCWCTRKFYIYFWTLREVLYITCKLAHNIQISAHCLAATSWTYVNFHLFLYSGKVLDWLATCLR
jgi:hypothetical protein